MCTVLLATLGGPAEVASAATQASTAGKFVPLSPQRILDTRAGIGAPAELPAVGASVTFQVTGHGGVPASGVTAVTLNVVLAGSRAAGYVQALPTGSGMLGASSNVNAESAGQTIANLVTVPVGDGGRVTLYNVAGGHLIADVLGYFTPATVSADGRYTPVSPVRLLDSRDRTGMPALTAALATAAVATTTESTDRDATAPAAPADVDCNNFATWTAANDWFWTYYPTFGDVARLDQDGDLIPCEGLPGASKVAKPPASPPTPPPPPPPPPPVFDPYPKPAPGQAVTVQVAGRGGVPAAGVSSVALTVTATDSSAAGFVQVVPTGGPTPLGTTSSLNLTGPGQTVANLVMVPLGTDGTVQLYNSSGTDLIADVVGYFTDHTASPGDHGLFVPLAPGRYKDTRAATAPAAGSETLVAPLGMSGLPTSGVSAVFFNATATGTAGPGYLQLFPTGQGVPGASSSLNYTGAGQTVASAVIAGIGDGSAVSVYTPTRTHFILDVFGYFTPATTTPLTPNQPEPHPVLTGLVVAPADPQAPYDRDTWNHWTDADGDCQDTRQEVLIAESVTTVVLDATGCRVVSGTWIDPYTGQTWTLPADLDVDHVVALKNAHDSGGWAWDAATKQAYANDLHDRNHLIAVEDNLNQSKGASGPESWQPPAADYRCTYAVDWVTIKKAWSLTVTQTEHDTLAQMLSTC